MAARQATNPNAHDQPAAPLSIISILISSLQSTYHVMRLQGGYKIKVMQLKINCIFFRLIFYQYHSQEMGVRKRHLGRVLVDRLKHLWIC